MKVSGYLSGGAAVLKSYQVNATVANIGIPLLAGTATEAGLDLPTTTNAVDMVGLNYDVATYATAQVTGGSPEAKVRVDIRPDAILNARLSGGATEGTALTQYTISAATTDGLDVTTGDDWTSPEFDEGAVWGYDGVNASQLRKITATGTTDATPLVAFNGNHQVGDNFLRAPYWPMDDGSPNVQLTAAFLEANAAIVVGTGA